MDKVTYIFKDIIKKNIKYIVPTMFLFMSLFFYTNNNEQENVEYASAPPAQVAEAEKVDKLLLNGEVIACCKNLDIAKLQEEVRKELSSRLNYEYEGELKFTLVKDVETGDESLHALSGEELLAKASDMAFAGIDNFKVQAYLMKIGDDFVVALKSAKDLTQALDYAKSKYLNLDEGDIGIDLVKDERNPLVFSPVLKLKKAVTKKTLHASTGKSEDAKEAEDGEDGEKIKESKLVEASFATDVIVVKTYVNEDEIKDVDTAKELITKENEKEKKYVVQKNDYPEIIAQKNDMPTEKLFELNPGLKNRQKSIQIGEELTVMVPEPELSVSTKEIIVYDEAVEFTTEYEKNPDKYVGNEKVKFEGELGVKRISAKIKTVNGVEVSREIVGEEVIKEPKAKIVLRGSKPLPSRGATGKFVCPLDHYVVTSRFGPRGRRYHKGIDLGAPIGTPVYAADGGVVIWAGYKRSYGNLVVIDHGDGIITKYAHNSAIVVKAGQYVSQYQVISKVGNTGRSTGPHLHFEIRLDGDAVNPQRFINF